jgi:Cof subfamily protein (haloacid dehalogenase superfamily)
MPRALIFDLDHTLLDRHKRMRPASRHALRAASDAGYRLVIATSRPMRSIRRFLPDDVLATSLIVSLNGAVVHEPGRHDKPRIIGGIEQSLDQLLAALDDTADGITYSVETDGHRFASSVELDPEMLRAIHHATPDLLVALDELNPRQVTKVAADGNGSRLARTLALAGDFPELRFIEAMDRTFVNIVAAGVDKATTLQMLDAAGALTLDASVAFGDDVPDCEMFSVVGRSVAMGNSPAAVKARASDVIGACDTDAIARFVLEEILR